MSASRFIASRLSFKSRVSLAATAVSAFVIVLAVCILSGFKEEIYNSISKFYAEINLSDNGSIKIDDPRLEILSKDKRIASISPAISQASLVQAGSQMQGVLFRSSPEIQDGNITSIPSSLARRLNLSQGDTLTAYFITDRTKVRRFRVSEIYEDAALLSEDQCIAFLSLESLQRIKKIPADQADCMEIRLISSCRDRQSIENCAIDFSNATGLQYRSSAHEFPALYDWLEILNANVLLILLLMCIVAAFNTISAFLIFIMRSSSTIGLLKTLGMSSSALSRSFLRLVSSSTIRGLLIGNLSALLLCAIQSATHILKLDPQNYFVSFVPVHIDLGGILIANLIAWLAIMLLTLLPTRRIARIDPALTTKGETL
ncbi:MAG: ABC transporter permease [Candidatus Cryptobacteroides sp.]